MIRELCAGGNAPKHLLVTEGKVIPDWAHEQDGMEIVRVQRHVADACSPGNDGFVGEFAIPPPPPKEHLIANKQRLGRVLVLDNVDDPGVLGTILRTAVGFQYDAIVATNHCADLYDHRVIRAARGAHFQRGVPIYTLRDEDGDNVYGMLNHVAERNNLMPVCVSGQDDASASTEAESGTFRSAVAGLTVPIALPARAPSRATLSDFCLDRFTKRDGVKEKGYMLFAGPNHKRNMLQRLCARVARPTTQLLVDSMPSDCDLLLPLSVAMHALRPAGDWDYLPLAEKHTASSMELQTRKMSVDIGANRLSVDASDLNLDEEEQVNAANTRNEFRKWRRLRKKQMSDYDFWLSAEERRVQEMLRNEQRRKATPWQAEETHKEKGAAGLPEWVPNIIDEYRQSLDRDRLVEERETSEAFVRPPNYDN
ncbi:hypothetical protein STCU_03121 [Strigomonas culicis]|uniref:tRNA/rRNA methyltransferase SpoU type domain-containing protein n=1 Tax=Strigomonas culicis TaxID=28005 RepID=S9USM2_9TRYP|nr:hypothetical protein STCU_03121 [Strigomonas culicis]|eukprot:EPY31903.1 hypothetical protein STCU_03121 [Strigomonas culicis]